MKSFISFVAIEICLIVVLFFSHPLLSQVITVRGNVTTAAMPVSYASIVFTDKNDTSKKFSAITDTLGNYRIGIITTVENNGSIFPSTIELEQNYPNPFSSSTAISYKLNKQSEVNIRIYNILGQEVKAFMVGSQGANVHTMLWDGRDNFGNKLAPGIYFYQLRAGNETQVKKMFFAGSGAPVSVPLFSGAFSLEGMNTHDTRELKKEEMRQLASGTYTVQIQNTDSTSPKILNEKKNDVMVQKDTTLNFVVETGKIVFVKLDTITYQNRQIYKTNVYTMNIGGSEITQLKNGNEIIDTPAGRGIRGAASEPRWSRDGKKIVYSESQGPDESHIVMMDEDGSNRKNLTPVGGYCIRPKWSPKRDRILYLRGTYMGAIIATSIVDTNSNSYDIHQSPESMIFEGDSVFCNLGDSQWRADGEHLYVWASIGKRPWDNTRGPGELFLMNISSGKVIERLTHNNIDEWGFEISSDGTRIVVFRGRYQIDTKIYLMSLTDSVLSPITTGTNDHWPRWSNDGKLIVYTKDINVDPYTSEDRIYMMNPTEPFKETMVSLYGGQPDLFVYH